MDFKKLLKIKGFPFDKASELIDEIQGIESLLEWQKEQAEYIMKYHFENNPFYKNLLKRIPEKWDDLPIVTKHDLVGDYRLKLSSNFNENIYVASTSGSSGHPFVFGKDKFCHALTWAFVAKCYKNVGISLNDLQARFYGIPYNWFGYSLELLKDWLSNRVRFVVFDLSDAVMDKWLVRFRKKKFKYIYGYTNSLVCFAKYLLRKKISLKQECPSLEACIVTSELCTTEDLDILKKAFGIQIINEYGASELGVIGLKTNSDWLVADELIYLEVVDENNRLLPDGKEGKLLCTSLFNRATPFIRYEIGDRAIIKRENGRTRITNLMGRVNDMALLPSGKKVPGLTFYYVARQILEKTDVVREFIVKQKTRELFAIEMVSTRKLTKNEVNMIKKGMDTYLEEGLKLDINNVERIERSGNGKFRHFTSEIK